MHATEFWNILSYQEKKNIATSVLDAAKVLVLELTFMGHIELTDSQLTYLVTNNLISAEKAQEISDWGS